MHWVLQMALDPHPGRITLRPAGGPLCTTGRRGTGSLGQPAVVDEYARRMLPERGGKVQLPAVPHQKSMASLLCYLRDEQRQSSFHPSACEAAHWRWAGCSARTVYQLSNGRTVQLVGAVDRADEWVEGRHPLGAGGGL